MARPEEALGDWPEVDGWRRAERERLLAERRSIRPAALEALSARIMVALSGLLDTRDCEVLGFYWPYRGEIDLRPLMQDLVGQGACVALPVVVAPAQPIEYRPWHPQCPLERGALGIPVPATREVVAPDLMLAPLLGFDDGNYRLGLGGGYFDRTLAAIEHRPWTIGVGIESARLTTIHPQPHDIPLDLVVTEAAIQVSPGNAATD